MTAALLLLVLDLVLVTAAVVFLLFVIIRRGRIATNLGLALRIEASRLVPIPAPCRALDPVDVEHAEIVGETIEFRATRTTGLLRVHQRHANPFADGAM